MKLILLALVLSMIAHAQGLKDTGPRYLGSYTVSALPAAASNSGGVAVVTDAATAGSCTSGSGSELALCRSSGSAWVTLGGGSGGTAVGLATTAGSDTQNVTAGAIRIGTKVTAIPAFSAVLSGSTASSTIYNYISSAGVPTCAHGGAATLTGTDCTVVTGITDWPANSLPVSTVVYTSNVMGTVTDFRVAMSRSVILPGDGIGVAEDANGNTVVSNIGSGSFTKYQQDVYFHPSGATDAATGVFGPILCWSTTGCATAQLTGGSRRWSTVAFSDSGTTLSSTINWRIPDNWDGGTVTLILDWTRGSGSGSTMVWSVQTVCFGTGDDVQGTSYNSAQVSSGLTAPSAGVRAEYSLSLTMTGCAAGEHLVVMPSRASGNASDDLAATVHLLGASISYKANLAN